MTDGTSRDDQPSDNAFLASHGMTRKYTTVTKDQLLLQLPVPPWGLKLPKWNPALDVPGWTLTGADVEMHRASLVFGSLIYERDSDQRRVLVGVRWDPEVARVEAQCLEWEEPVPLRDRDAVDADALERSTIRRAAKLIEVNSFIGAAVSDYQAETTILESAGLGLERLPPLPPEEVRDPHVAG
ncbi:hypothetical protein [Frondihabitans sp. Leaf304]|uniref:hypothetical protein n=1 Tax=Frondihabitans sp. Leaf304 TaxID=1736329 RepID=UPI0006FC8E1A|nr:hypothetical protein [Frondihabitans sp. Leaf304]KQQ28657.1 hypothetical protein ASF54_08410 [Frondihabitans sp. Leaf304]